MTALYLLTAIGFGVLVWTTIINKPFGVFMAVIILISLWTEFQRVAGTPAGGDTRLSAEQWLVLSVAQTGTDEFFIGVRYPNGDMRAYRLNLPTQEERDKFLSLQQRMQRGLMMMGRAKHPRIGQSSDGGMDFEFGEAPESEPKRG